MTEHERLSLELLSWIASGVAAQTQMTLLVASALPDPPAALPHAAETFAALADRLAGINDRVRAAVAKAAGDRST